MAADMDKFTVEHFVIISSTVEIDMTQWRKFIVSNWFKPGLEGFRRINGCILTLTGVHGGEDGKIGFNDAEQFVEQSKKQIKLLQNEKNKKFAAVAKDAKARNIKFEVADIGSAKDKSKIDPVKLVKAVKEHNPTVMLLAFCHSNVSELNDILRASGIYSTLIMREEKAQVTTGGYVLLDEGQIEVLRYIADEEQKNVFIWGTHGTGKSIIIQEIVNMKVSHFLREKGNKKLKIMVSNFSSINDNLELEKVQKEHLQRFENLKFESSEDLKFESISKLCDLMNVTFDPDRPLDTISTLASAIDTKHPDYYTILMIDEVISHTTGDSAKRNADWSKFSVDCENVDVVMAVSPIGPGNQCHSLTPPQDATLFFSRQLVEPHRSSFQIRKLQRWLRYHSPMHLSSESDIELPAHKLPPGNIPIWISRTQEVTDEEVLKWIITTDKLGYNVPKDSQICVVYDKDKKDEKAEQWCLNQTPAWKYLNDREAIGIEANIVIVIDSVDPELVSRARNEIIFVITRRLMKTKTDLLLKEKQLTQIMNHVNPKFDCIFNPCGFTGQELLRKINMGNDEEHQIFDDNRDFSQSSSVIISYWHSRKWRKNEKPLKKKPHDPNMPVHYYGPPEKLTEVTVANREDEIRKGAFQWGSKIRFFENETAEVSSEIEDVCTDQETQDMRTVLTLQQDPQVPCMEEGNFCKQFELDWPVNYLVADEKMLCVVISNKHFRSVMCDVDKGTAVWDILCQDIPQYLLSYADTAEGIKLDMTEKVVVTATGCGVVKVWDRSTRKNIYSGTPHGYSEVLGVSAKSRENEEIVVTGGSDGSLTFIKVEVDTILQNASVKCLISTGRVKITHIDCDGLHLIVGTLDDLKMYDVKNISNPKLMSTVKSGDVSCCALAYPYAVCSGEDMGLAVWNMVKGKKIRHLHPDLLLYSVQIKDNILVTNVSVGQGQYHDLIIHNINDIINPDIKDENLTSLKVKSTNERYTDFTLNENFLFAVAENNKFKSKIKIWELSNLKKALDATKETSWKKTAGSPIQAKKLKPTKINKVKVLKLVDFYEKMEEKKLRRQSASTSKPVEDINIPAGKKHTALKNVFENVQPVKQTLDGDTDLCGAGGETLENLSGPQQQQPF